jgi:hypothetical protein
VRCAAGISRNSQCLRIIVVNSKNTSAPAAALICPWNCIEAPRTATRTWFASPSINTGGLRPAATQWVRLRITGPTARDVLAKGISLDLHPKVFQIGRGAHTGLHHTGVFLERVEDESYEIYVPRTYAESIWEWLSDAALPFGYDVAVEGLAP